MGITCILDDSQVLRINIFSMANPKSVILQTSLSHSDFMQLELVSQVLVLLRAIVSV